IFWVQLITLCRLIWFSLFCLFLVCNKHCGTDCLLNDWDRLIQYCSHIFRSNEERSLLPLLF
ncbi:unnamed protein product, partial [Linum tenue]